MFFFLYLRKHFLGFLALLWLCTGNFLCAQSDVAMFYHNTTAYYNGYFHAKTHLDALHRYTSRLPLLWHTPIEVFDPIDSVKYVGVKETIDKVIRFCSGIIQYHQASTWRDWGYLSLAQARIYQGNTSEAEKIYQYLSRRSKDSFMIQRAQIGLLILYVRMGRYHQASAVLNIIRRSPPRSSDKKEDIRLLYAMAKGYLAQKQENTAQVVEYIEEALSLTRDKYLKTRFHLILGEHYVKLGRYAEARHHYRRCHRRNISYSMYLLSQLRAWSCEVSVPSRVRKKFRKALRSGKNADYVGYIHWEWGRFEEHIGEDALAQENYSLAAELIEEDTPLKARALLRNGALYYKKADYVQAHAYYDSAYGFLTDSAPEYESVVRRQAVLSRFIVPYKSVQLEDSLLRLGVLGETIARTRIASGLRAEAALKREKSARRAERLKESRRGDRRSTKEKAEKKESKAIIRTIGNAPEKGARDSWYFSSQDLISQGRRNFIEIWGERPLTDHWRRSVGVQKERNLLDNRKLFTTEETSGKKEVFEDDTLGEASLFAEKVNTLVSQVPFDSSAQSAARQRLTDSYFALCKAYYFDLEEPVLSATCFKEMLGRFRGCVYEANAWYILTQNESLSESERTFYGEALVGQYPDSLYAKLYLQPSYLVDKASEARALEQAYDSLYPLYEKGEYSALRRRLESLLLSYSLENSFFDNVVLMRILLEGHLGSRAHYMYRLARFLRVFEQSELRDYVVHLQSMAQEVQKDFIYSTLPRYSVSGRGGAQGFVWVCASSSAADTLLRQVSQGFVEEAQIARDLGPSDWKIGHGWEKVLLADNTWLVLGLGFDISRSKAMYRRAMAQEWSARSFFYLSEKHLSLLFDTKDVEAYTSFFSRNLPP